MKLLHWMGAALLAAAVSALVASVLHVPHMPGTLDACVSLLPGCLLLLTGPDVEARLRARRRLGAVLALMGAGLTVWFVIAILLPFILPLPPFDHLTLALLALRSAVVPCGALLVVGLYLRRPPSRGYLAAMLLATCAAFGVVALWRVLTLLCDTIDMLMGRP